MRRLKRFQGVFAHHLRTENTRLYLGEPVDSGVMEHLAKAKDRQRRFSGCLGFEKNVFVKTVRLQTLPSMLRATFGLRRSHGMFDWPIAELINNLEATKRKAPIAKVVGYGVRRNKVGLTDQVILLSEHLDGYVDAHKWLSEPACELKCLIQDAFGLLAELNSKQVYHLDLWLGNIMLHPSQPRQLRAVDLENAYIGPALDFAAILGFQLGFLYHRELMHCMDEAEYDQLVNAALPLFPEIDREHFDAVYTRCKHHHYSRKRRYQLALGSFKA